MPAVAQLLRVLDAAPWFTQAIAIVAFAYVLCQPALLTPLLGAAIAVHVISFVSLCRFLSPHRTQQHKTIPATPTQDAALAGECPDDKPGISIIKPIAGTNDNLRENLESCFQLAYPKFELLFCLHDADDEAVGVVEGLIARYPAVDAKLLYGEADLEGASPKVRNMAKGYSHAKHDIFWAIDAKIRTSDGDVDAMLAQLQPGGQRGCGAVGLVHQLPWNRSGADASASLERMFFAGEHARAYCLINGLGLPAINGMSLMCTRDSWAAIGGCAALAVTVAEDSLVGVLMHNKGYTCVMAAVPCVQNPPPASVRNIVSRRARWYQLKMDIEIGGGRLRQRLGQLLKGLKLSGLWLLNLLLPFAVIWRGLATSTIVWDCNGTLKPMHPRPYSPAKSSELKVRRVASTVDWGVKGVRGTERMRRDKMPLDSDGCEDS